MGKLFRYGSPLMKFLDRIADLIVLNLLWSLCSLPVVTVGPATTALYACLHRLDTDTGHMIPNFFRAFRENFRPAAGFWLLMLPVGLALGWNGYLLSVWDFPGKTLLFLFLLAVALLYGLILVWYFPLLANYRKNLRGTFLNALTIGLANPLNTLELLLFALLPFGLLLFRTDWFLWSLIFWAFLGKALLLQLSHVVFRHVCRKYAPPEPKPESEA